MRGNIALIPARGNSIRIPKKNIYPFFGHPMIAYAIAAAKNSQLFEHIIVSTEDPLIGRIAEWYGAEYLQRPDELSSESTNFPDVALHTLTELKGNGEAANILCQLMPNCPLRRSDDIINHVQAFNKHKRDFQISTVSYRGVYPHWAIACDKTGKGAWLYTSDPSIPSQDLHNAVCPTGAIWCVRVPKFLEQKVFYGNPFHIEHIDANRGIDIDVQEEIELAKLLVHGLEKRDKISPLEPIDCEPFPTKYE